jgi:hypothetical protein
MHAVAALALVSEWIVKVTAAIPITEIESRPTFCAWNIASPVMADLNVPAIRYPATARNLLVRMLLAILAAIRRKYDNSQPSDACVVIEKRNPRKNGTELASHAGAYRAKLAPRERFNISAELILMVE